MATKATDSSCETSRQAVALLMEGRAVDASRLLAEALAQAETPELWNDWAVAQLHLAEGGFRRALQGDPLHADAAANLGLLLFCIGKRAEASIFLEKSLASAPAPVRAHIQSLLNLCLPQHAAAPDSEAIRREVCSVLEEYFLRQNRSQSVVTLQRLDPQSDPQPLWIENALNNGVIHDEDYLVLGAFQDPDTTILDIGAHFGYSVVSIWSSGAKSCVISFEANRRFEPCLRRLAELRPGRYNYRTVALGDGAGVLQFAMPVLNGQGLGALATACASPDLSCLTQNVIAHFEKYCSGQGFQSFRIHPFESPVARLDDLLAAGGFSVPSGKIVAVKIDTEGQEAQVLSGCPSLLAAQRPLVLAEGGHSNPAVRRQLRQLGYLYARRDARQLQIVSAPTETVNGFFLHPEHADEYRRIGLLQS